MLGLEELGEKLRLVYLVLIKALSQNRNCLEPENLVLEIVINLLRRGVEDWSFKKLVRTFVGNFLFKEKLFLVVCFLSGFFKVHANQEF